MKRFKKIYIEITNNCNLNCSFCIKKKRQKRNMSIKEFTHILNEIKSYTDYLYFHVLGEPLIHPDINEMIDLASERFKVNITTNGYFIEKIINNKNIRQMNISLHDYDENKLASYLDNILKVTEILRENGTIINYRIWQESKYKDQIIKRLNEYYEMEIDLRKNYKLGNRVFINQEKSFVWPEFNNEINCESGTCLALKDHIGILVDGTVVPCCLDGNGVINLGNIFASSLEDILCKKRVLEMQEGFKNKIKREKLCKKCNFYFEKTKM